MSFPHIHSLLSKNSYSDQNSHFAKDKLNENEIKYKLTIPIHSTKKIHFIKKNAEGITGRIEFIIYKIRKFISFWPNFDKFVY